MLNLIILIFISNKTNFLNLGKCYLEKRKLRVIGNVSLLTVCRAWSITENSDRHCVIICPLSVGFYFISPYFVFIDFFLLVMLFIVKNEHVMFNIFFTYTFLNYLFQKYEVLIFNS